MVLDRFSTAVQRFRRSSVLRRRSTRKYSTSQRQLTWEILPSNILIQILAQCDLNDIYALALVCRVLHRRIYQHEPAIAQEYLFCRLRKSHGSPGDDLTFITNLFPPPPPQYPANDTPGDNSPEYSFFYLSDLTRCWRTCVRLSFYLAGSAVQHHLETNFYTQPSREQEAIYSKAVGQLQDKLLYPITYLIYFLESDAAATTPPSSSIESQQSILQQSPFTDTEILLSTHHCMTLLCNCIRRLMAPDIQYPSTEPWLRLLLTTSTLERTLNFFEAASTDTTTENSEKKEKVAGSAVSASWTPRMEFIWQMRNDWEEIFSIAREPTFDVETKAEAVRALTTAGVEEVLFEAARREMERRGVIPHEGGEGVPVLHGEVIGLRCEFCD